MRRLVCAIALCAASALAIPPAVVGNVPGRRVKLEVSDNFNRANGPVGSNWTTNTSGQASCQISSNMVAPLNGVTDAGHFWSANSFAGDQFSEVYLPGANINQTHGVTVRAVSGATVTFYGAKRSRGTGTATLSLFRVVAGSYVSLGSITSFSQASMILRIEAVGSSVAVYSLATHGGAKTLLLSATDSTISSGSPGFIAYYSGAPIGLDNWYGGDL